MKKLVTALTFAVSMLIGSAASAVPVAFVDLSADAAESVLGTISAGQTVEFQFTALEELQVTGIALSATGPIDPFFGDPLGLLSFGFMAPPTNFLSTILTVGSVSAGSGFLDILDSPLASAILETGEVFSIFISNASAESIVLTTTLATSSVAPIPLPASGLLLLGTLAGLGLYRRRKSHSMA